MSYAIGHMLHVLVLDNGHIH